MRRRNLSFIESDWNLDCRRNLGGTAGTLSFILDIPPFIFSFNLGLLKNNIFNIFGIKN